MVTAHFTIAYMIIFMQDSYFINFPFCIFTPNNISIIRGFYNSSAHVTNPLL